MNRLRLLDFDCLTSTAWLRLCDFDRLTWTAWRRPSDLTEWLELIGTELELNCLDWTPLRDCPLGTRTSRVDPLGGVKAVVAVVAIGAIGAVRAVGTVRTVRAMWTLGTVRAVWTVWTLRRNCRNPEVLSDVITEESSIWGWFLNEGSWFVVHTFRYECEGKDPRYPLAKTLTIEDGRCKHPTGMTHGKIQTFLSYKCLVFSIIITTSFLRNF